MTDIARAIMKSKNRDYISLVLSLLLQIAGYVMLVAVDWRIAVAVFFIHSSINIEREVAKRQVLYGIWLSGKGK